MSFAFIGLLIPIAILLLVLKIGKTPRKVTHWLLYGYSAILVIATLSIPFITDPAIKLDKINREEFDAQSQELQSKLGEGRLDAIDSSFLMSERSIEIEPMETMRLEAEREDFYYTVFVESKKQNDRDIEVFIYRDSGFIMDGYDFSFKLEPMHYYLRDQVLTFAPRDQHIRLAFDAPNFTTRQFSEDTFMDRWGMSGHQIVYLRVPLDLEVITSDERISLQTVSPPRL